MPVYHPAIVDPEGRLEPQAFRRAFFTALEQFRINPASFFLSETETARQQAGAPVAPIQRSLLERRFQASTSAAKGAQEDVLEELSDIEDEEDEASSTSSSSGGSDERHHRRLEESPGHTTLLKPHRSRLLLGQPPAAARASTCSGGSGGATVARLKIVFDLDNTLLHAQSKYKLNMIEPTLDEFKDSRGRPELFRFTLPRQNNQAYFIKFRPGATELLAELAKYCELAIHTNATREYADIVMSIIDADRSIFGARVAARDDDSGKNDRKDMNRLFAIDREKLLPELLILDDRRDVWDSCFERNIIQCNYYEYFESRRDLLAKKYEATTGQPANLPGSRSSEEPAVITNVDVIDSYMPDNFTKDNENQTGLEDYDRQLFFLQRLIVSVAKEFYQHSQTGQIKSVADILQSRRSKILEGVVVLMTGYHKVEQASQFGMLDNGPQHRRRLEYMGARVVEAPSEEVTHVLVMRQTVSTDRARSQCNRSTKFVHNLWIYACEQTWTKVAEEFFDASTLLSKWSKPPSRPLFEHWAQTRLFFESLCSEGSAAAAASGVDGTSCDLKAAGSIGMIKANSPIAAIKSDSDSTYPDTEACDNSAGRSWRKRRNTSPAEPSVTQKRRLDDMDFVEREWTATGPFSDGAEVWSCAEHIRLRYDPFVSAALLRKSTLVA